MWDFSSVASAGSAVVGLLVVAIVITVVAAIGWAVVHSLRNGGG